MEAILYDKTGKVKLGNLVDILNDSNEIEEERNGMFDLVFDYPNGYPLADQLIEENFVEVKPNDEQGNQKFRIYSTKKLIDDVITVFARHETFDLANDHVENINLENASCEYALNTLFENSHFSKDFRGYSDIVNAQDYKIDNVNILNAVAGKEGSIIDTYGTGAEILRDGKNIHVLNKRGHDNGVTIEYGKNLTGFELTVDLEGLETRCGGFAKYKPEGSQEEVMVKSDWIDSPFIENFAHPYINVEGRRDYSDKFKDGFIPTKEALNKLCQDEFKINKRDIPANNYKINFIPLSKCVGYEGIKDKISLCDTVTIIDPRFNINTKAKVIKYKYDFIKERYISMELGEPRTTLGDIIGNGGKVEQGPPGPPGKDGNVEDFPNSLPVIPILTANVKGFASIDLSWTYEDKVYYTYEVYASKTRDFTPNTFDLIHEGQTSSFLFQAKPNETWYFRVCAKNTHGNRTEFSPQVAVTTNKADNFDEYFSSLAVGNLVANIFSADYMEAGIIKGHWIDAKNLSVTDGNGVRRLDINSFGRFYLQPSEFILDTSDTNVPTKAEVSNAVGVANSYTDTQVNIVAGQIREKVSQSDYDENNRVLKNQITEVSKKADGITQTVTEIENWKWVGVNTCLDSKFAAATSNAYGFNFRKAKLKRGERFTLSANGRVSGQGLQDGKKLAVFIYNDDWTWSRALYIDTLDDTTGSVSFDAPDNGYHNVAAYMYPDGGSRAGSVTINYYKVEEGDKATPWAPSPEDTDAKFSKQETKIEQLSNKIETKVDVNGVKSTITQSALEVVNAFNSANPNIQSAGKFIIYNGMFEMYNKSGAKTMYIDDGGLVASNTGFGTYAADGSGIHTKGNIIYHVPNSSGSYDNMYIESNHPVYFKTAVSWDGVQGKDFQRIKTSGVLLDGKAWDSSGIQVYLLGGDYEADTVVLYNQFKSLSMNLKARNIECDQITVTGAKNRIVETEKFGTRKMNAVESAECYFEDRGRGSLINGSCKILIDEIFAETVDLTDYDVSITKYGRGDIWVAERTNDYFIVEGENDIEFSYTLYAKQLGYENERLEVYKSNYKEVTTLQNQMFINNVTYEESKQGNAWKLYTK